MSEENVEIARGMLEAANNRDPWDETARPAAEIEDIIERDERVFVGLLLAARGRASGVETELRTWNVFWFMDGKIRKRQVFWTQDEALEAAGLSE
jgi:hypothetical protein